MIMLKFLITALLFSVFMVSASEKIPAIHTIGTFEKSSGHIQGGCISNDAVFLSHKAGIFKLDRTGKLLKHVPTVIHTGDICFYNGKVYSAICYYDQARKGKGAIKEYSSDLEELRTYELDFPIDGITCLNGFLYFGVGPNPPALHRGNRVAKMPADFSGKPEIFPIDHGYMTNYGPQTMTNDGKNIFISFYSSQKNSCRSAIFSSDLQLIKALDFEASMGFDVFPGIGNGKDPVFFKLCETNSKKTKSRRLNFYKYKDGKMVNVTGNAAGRK